jgi:hypothetical protein
MDAGSVAGRFASMPSKRPHDYRGPVILFRLIRSAAEAGHDWSVYLFNLEDRIPTDHLLRRITGLSSGGRRIRKRQQRVCLVSIAILGFGMMVTVAPLTATVIDAVPMMKLDRFGNNNAVASGAFNLLLNSICDKQHTLLF